jgi:hypothetical protein
MRQTLEAMHAEGDPQKILSMAWPYLSHSDRHVRYAARVAIERLPVELWKAKALAETHPQALIEAMVALARMSGGGTGNEGGKPASKPAGTSSAPIGSVAPDKVELQGQMLRVLTSLKSSGLTLNQQLASLRALQLVLIRLGKPAPEVCAKTAAILEAAYPAEDALINRELCQLLVVLDSTKAPVKTLALMATAKDDFQEVATDAVLSRNDGYANAARAAAGSRPNGQQISYMFALRNATAGWTPELRKTYFSWFPRARTWKGGNSFKGFIENIRKDAMATFVPKEELASLEELSSKTEAITIPNYVAPQGPGKAWTVDEVVKLTANGGLKGRDFTNGEAMYRSTMCAYLPPLQWRRRQHRPGSHRHRQSLHHARSDGKHRRSQQSHLRPIRQPRDHQKRWQHHPGPHRRRGKRQIFIMTNPFAPNDQWPSTKATSPRKKPAKSV